MNDCKLIIEIKDGEILYQGENASLVELAYMCGALEQTIGLELFSNGKPLDDIKNDMLQLHLDAMYDLENQIIEQERSREHGS